MRTLSLNLERFVKLRNSLKQAAVNLQQELNTLQATLEAETKEHALAIQSLKHEFKCHGVTEKCLKATERRLKHERATVKKLTEFLNKLEFPNEGSLSIALPGKMSLGAFLHEQESMGLELESKNSEVRTLQQELQRTINELQYKQLVLENLREGFEIQPQSKSKTCFSCGDEESEVKTAELQQASIRQGKRRRS